LLFDKYEDSREAHDYSYVKQQEMLNSLQRSLAGNLLKAQRLDKQILDIQQEGQKLEETERRLSLKVEEFRSRNEFIKVQYSAAEAQVMIDESVTGL